MSNKQVKFNVGDERIGPKGQTLRLCQTTTGKLQWRQVAEDGNVLKRGRPSGSKILTEMALSHILQSVGGKKFVSGVKALAEKEGIKIGEVNIPVSTQWGASTVSINPTVSTQKPAPKKGGTKSAPKVGEVEAV